MGIPGVTLPQYQGQVMQEGDILGWGLPCTSPASQSRRSPIWFPAPQTPVLGGHCRGTWPETSTSAPSSSSLRTVARPVVLGTTTVTGNPSFLAAYAAARPAFPPVGSRGQAGLTSPPRTPVLLTSIAHESRAEEGGANYLRSKRSGGSPSWQPERQERREGAGCVPPPSPL